MSGMRQWMPAVFYHTLTAAAMVGGVLGLARSCPANVDVAIVAAATNSNIMSERFTDLRDVLVADGRFGTVEIISTTRFGTGTPSLTELLQYDSIIHWTNDSNDDSVALGNVFADYVDQGRGLVQAVFANTSTNPDRYLQGRWLTGPYNIIPPNGGFVEGVTPGAGALTETAVMSPPLEPDHPVFEGVGEVRLSTGMLTTGGLFGAWRPATEGILPGARKIALWDDGKTAVAVSNVFPNRLDLGLHPVSDLVNDGYYDRTSDAGKLIANALLYTASFALPSGDFDGNGLFECADVDSLVVEIVAVAAGGTPDDGFDLNGDGTVDTVDLNQWLVNAGADVNSPTGGNPFLHGDANLDGVVDTGDFNLWNANKFTLNPAWCRGDFTADGVVDVSDFGVWVSNKFQSAAGAMAVPEPTVSWLVWLGGAVWLFLARRSSAKSALDFLPH